MHSPEGMELCAAVKQTRARKMWGAGWDAYIKSRFVEMEWRTNGPVWYNADNETDSDEEGEWQRVRRANTRQQAERGDVSPKKVELQRQEILAKMGRQKYEEEDQVPE